MTRSPNQPRPSPTTQLGYSSKVRRSTCAEVAYQPRAFSVYLAAPGKRNQQLKQAKRWRQHFCRRAAEKEQQADEQGDQKRKRPSTPTASTPAPKPASEEQLTSTVWAALKHSRSLLSAMRIVGAPLDDAAAAVLVSAHALSTADYRLDYRYGSAMYCVRYDCTPPCSTSSTCDSFNRRCLSARTISANSACHRHSFVSSGWNVVANKLPCRTATGTTLCSTPR